VQSQQFRNGAEMREGLKTLPYQKDQA
jgi:hypothetical protein